MIENEEKRKLSPDVKACPKVKEDFNDAGELCCFCHCLIKHCCPWKESCVSRQGECYLTFDCLPSWHLTSRSMPGLSVRNCFNFTRSPRRQTWSLRNKIEGVVFVDQILICERWVNLAELTLQLIERRPCDNLWGKSGNLTKLGHNHILWQLAPSLSWLGMIFRSARTFWNTFICSSVIQKLEKSCLPNFNCSEIEPKSRMFKSLFKRQAP